MKRFLCTILAIAMVIAMIPVAFASGVSGTNPGYYEFSYNATGVTNGGAVTAVNDYNKNNKANGWKFISIDDEAKKVADNGNDRVYQIQTEYLRINSYRTNANGPIRLENGIQLALAIEKPSTEPGFYKVTVVAGSNLSSNVQFYMGKWDGDQKSVDTYMTERTKFNSEVVKPVADNPVLLDGFVYNDGTNDFALGIDTLGLCTFDFKSLRLDELSSPEIVLSLDKTNLGVGETATASVDVTSEQVTQKLLNEYVKYESDNEDVAKVSELGEITTYKTGTAKITATVGGVDYTQKINVVDLSGYKVEYGTYFVTNKPADVAYYGPHEFTYALKNGTLSYYKAVCTETDGIACYWDQTAKTAYTGLSHSEYRFVAAHDLKPGSDDYAAYKIRIPAAGDYMASLVYLARRNVQQIQDESGNPVEEVASPVLAATSADMYILPISAASDITAALATATPVISNVNFYSTTNQFKTTEEVVFSAPSAGEYLMVWKNTGDTGKRITPVKLTLNGGDGKAPI